MRAESCFGVALLGTALSCGVSVHLSLVNRLIPHLPANVQLHASYVRAGAFYPDAFYDCMGLSEAAEDAHWPPFLAAGAELIKEKNAIGIDTSKLEAFLVGVLSHQVADVAWHSLGLQQGLLQVMADSEFDGDYDAAHSVLDVGGDMIQVMRLQRSGQDLTWLNNAWDYDVDDILEILRRLQHYTSAGQVRYCMARGRAALAAEQSVATTGYKRYARQSPLLFDKLETYSVGGLSDMTQKTLECLPSLLDWIDTASQSDLNNDPWDICQMFDGKRPRNTIATRDLSELTLKQNLVHKPPSLVSLEGLRGLLTDIPESHPKSAVNILTEKNLTTSSVEWSRFGAQIINCADKAWAVSAPGESKVYIYGADLKLQTTISGPAFVAGQYEPEFGESLIFYQSQSDDGESHDALLVSSPGLNRVDAYNLNGSWHGAIAFPNATSVYGSRGPKMIGEQLVIDSGTGTLYLGCPSCDLEEFDQAGTVLAVPLEALTEAFYSNATIEHDYDSAVIISGTKSYARMGSRISVTPRFVLMGSPGTSEVYGLDRLTHKILLKLTDEDASGFGANLLDGNGNYIIIGASLTDSTSQSGKIYLYKNNQRREVTLHDPQFADRLGHFGIFDGQKYLYSASPHAFDERGALWRLDCQNGELVELALGPSPHSSAFGEALALNSTGLLVGLPFYNNCGAFAFVPLGP